MAATSSFVEVARDAVRDQHQGVAGLELHVLEQVGLHARRVAQRTGQQVAVRAHARLALAELTIEHLLVDPRVVDRDQARVASVTR